MSTDVKAEMYINGAWTNLISDGVLVRDGIDISYGRANWSSTVSPSRATFSLDNRTGKWSPDNPTSPVHGRYKRNLPVRLGVAGSGSYVQWVGYGSGETATTPHFAGLNLTGDLDVRYDFTLTGELKDVALDGTRAPLSSNQDVNGGWSVRLYKFANGLHAGLQWTQTGGVTKLLETYGIPGGLSLPWSILYDRTILRVTLQTSTGTARFYLGDSITGPFTEIGTGHSLGVATTLGTTASLLRVCSGTSAPNTQELPGKLHRMQIRSGIGGTVVVDSDFTTATPGAATFTDSTGRVWTVGSVGEIKNTSWRFHGEMSSLPVRWDTQGKDVWAPVEAAGLLRRLKQGAKVLHSPIRRALDIHPNVVGYWPMEESKEGQLQLFSPAKGTVPLRVTGAINASADETFTASEKIPILGAGSLTVYPPPYTLSTGFQVRHLLYIPAQIGTANIDFLEVQAADLIWRLRYAPVAGTVQLLCYRAGTLIGSSAAFTFAINGKPGRINLNVTQSGANVNWGLTFQAVTAILPGGGTGTINNALAGAVSRITINKDSNFINARVGHLALYNQATTDELLTDINAYKGEAAGIRIQRLCKEEGLKSRVLGDPLDTTVMGPQTQSTLIDLLEECANTDLGILFEPQDQLSVGYRTRASQQNQNIQINFDYASGHILGSPELDRDDQEFSNDVTVTNWNRNFAQAQITTGDLSILEPPTGAGKYDTSFNVSTTQDDMLPSHADARLSLYSVNEPRISNISTDLQMPTVKPNSALVASILEARLGDLVEIDSMLPKALPGSVRQILQGGKESIGTHRHIIDYNTTPYSPWDTGLFDNDARYDTAGSQTTNAIAVNASSFQVTTTLGPIWTTVGTDMPFDIMVDGIRVTVTAISGASSPQTFTVTPATVVRAIPAGSKVCLAEPTLYTL